MYGKFFLIFFTLCSLLRAEVRLNYGYLFYENGHPHMRNASRRPITTAYDKAFEEPNLIVQTGYYSFRLDCDTLAISGYDAIEGSSYKAALTEDVEQFTAANLLLVAYKGNKVFTLTRGIVQDTVNLIQKVRHIEAGQYVQRIDHLGVILTASDGEEIEGRLEVSAWPTHLNFTLDLEAHSEVTRSTIRIISPDGVAHLMDRFQSKITLSVRPHEDILEPTLSPTSSLPTATNAFDDSALVKSWDTELHALRLDLPTRHFSPTVQAANHDMLEEYTFVLTNSSSDDRSIPLMFAPDFARAVTGTVMMLCHDDGRPTGIPVQVSKNWHGTAGTTPHAGSWLRGYTMIPLAAGESKSFRLKMIYGYWGKGDFAAVSHTSLCLIGWGNHTNWKWDIGSLGAWGESTTIDFSQHAGAAFFDDVRPTFTTPLPNTFDTHWFSENVGGGDLLNYTDAEGLYQPGKLLKTCYLWSGPNMTEVLYSGKTADEKIRFTYRIRSNGSHDYYRRYNSFTYEFLEDVITPTRLTLYQHGADYYSNTNFSDVFIESSEEGLSYYNATSLGGNVYQDPPIAFDDSWMTILDDTTYQSDAPGGIGNETHCSRGIINHGATLNGQDYSLYLHPYDRTLYTLKTKIYDTAGSTTSESFSAGDILTGAFTLILPANDKDEYWGEDLEFFYRLHYKQPWNIVKDEVEHNVELDVTVRAGDLITPYPLDIQSSTGSTLVELTVNSGGLGHLPIILRDVHTGRDLKAQRLINGVWVDLETVTIDAHDYYQGFLNDKGMMDYTFSIKRPSLSLNEPWTIRILGSSLSYQDWIKAAPIYADQEDITNTSEHWLSYVLNKSPLGEPMTSESFTLDRTAFSFYRNPASSDYFDISAQISTDLTNWEDINLVTPSDSRITLTPTENGYEHVSVSLEGDEVRRFARLKIAAKEEE